MLRAVATVIYVYAKLPAQDVERAQRFYEDMLGMSAIAVRNGHAYYEAGGVRFVIFPSTGAPSGTHDQIGIVVEDLVSEMAALRQKGLVFESFAGLTGDSGMMELGPMKQAWFKDSEGNLVGLVEKPGVLSVSASAPEG